MAYSPILTFCRPREQAQMADNISFRLQVSVTYGISFLIVLFNRSVPDHKFLYGVLFLSGIPEKVNAILEIAGINELIMEIHVVVNDYP